MADRITNKGSVTGIDLTESLIIKTNSIKQISNKKY
jgi:hypothetical protein